MKHKVEYSMIVREKMKVLRKNYFFYYLDKDSVIVAEMFDEREDFMIKLFGISSTTEESLRFWGE